MLARLIAPLLLLALCPACASWANPGPNPSGPRLLLQPEQVRPGDPVLLRVVEVGAAPQGKLGGRALTFYPIRGGFQAITGLPVEHEPGQVEVKLTVPGEGAPKELSGSLAVQEPGYPEKQLTVAAKYIEPPASVKKRMAEDREAFAQAFSQPPSPPLFQKNFAWPRKAEITAPYGDRRTFNGKQASQHFGTDLDGDIGAPVNAANDGVVVMVRDCYAAGLAVVIHHGAELYTAYFHLSDASVKQGQSIRRGELLGKVGKSGRVTGPHLHFGVKVDGLWVNAETLLRLSFE